MKVGLPGSEMPTIMVLAQIKVGLPGPGVPTIMVVAQMKVGLPAMPIIMVEAQMPKLKLVYPGQECLS